MAWLINYTDQETGQTIKGAYLRFSSIKLNATKYDNDDKTKRGLALFVGAQIFASKQATIEDKRPIKEPYYYLEAGEIDALPADFDSAATLLYTKRELFTLDVVSDDI